MKERTRNLLELHIATFLLAFPGLFGKWLTLHPIVIVFGRVFFASIALGIALLWTNTNLRLQRKEDYRMLLPLGILLAFHWSCFFISIRLASVAVGLITFATFPVFTALLEPLMARMRPTLLNVIVAFITFGGVAIMIEPTGNGGNLLAGTLWGLGSACSFAFLSILNRSLVQRTSAIVITFYQDVIACAVLLPLVLFIFQPEVTARSVFLLSILGFLFTAVAHSLFIKGMKSISAQTASVINSLETVYGVVLAAYLFNEVPSFRTILGGAIILGAAIFASVHSRTKELGS